MIPTDDSAQADPAYGDGYEEGRAMLHVLLRSWDGSHGAGCGCELCVTVESVRAQASQVAARAAWSAVMAYHGVHGEAGPFG